MYVITDWANNIKYNNKKFKTEEDAFDFLYKKKVDLDEFIVMDEKDFKPSELDTEDLLMNKTHRSCL